MGVIHKLNKEVVSFIIEKKKEDPSIGCRKLSEITSELFKVKVSKSSVSTVLKDSNLSSSVGRRVRPKAKSRKFKIPTQKKKQLLDSISSLGFTLSKDLVPEKDLTQKTKAKKKQKAKHEDGFSLEKLSEDLERYDLKKRSVRISSKETDFKDIVTEKDTGLSKKEKEWQGVVDKKPERGEYVVPVGPKFFDEEEFFFHLNSLRQKKKEEKQSSVVLKNAGVVFLKAALSELVGEGFFGYLFGKHNKGRIPEKFNDICSCLLFLKAFSINTVEEIEFSSREALWYLNGFTSYPGTKQLFEWTQHIDFSKELVIEYLNERAQSQKTVRLFRLCIEDGSTIDVDAQLQSIFSENNPNNVNFPINYAMEMLSKFLVSNNVPLALNYFDKRALSEKQLWKLMIAFEGLFGQKIQNIEVLDENLSKITDISMIPLIKRKYVVGIGEQAGIFRKIAASYKEKKQYPYHNKNNDSVMYYSERVVDYDNFKESVFGLSGREKERKTLKVIAMSENKGEPCKQIIFTNMVEEISEKAIDSYFLRWPKGGFIDNDEAKNSMGTEARVMNVHHEDSCLEVAGFENFGDIFRDYLSVLNEHCKNKYFPLGSGEGSIKPLIPMFYGLDGHITSNDQKMNIIFRVPKEYNSLWSLDYAIDRVNNRHITLYGGKVLYLAKEIF